MSIQVVMMLPSEAASVSLARHTLAEAMNIAHVDSDCIHEAQVALSEACTNVFRHVPEDQNFEVLINVGDVELTMHILDSGPGFPHGQRLSEWPDEAAENGRGMALMTAFSDHASFESAQGGGSVRLKKRLRPRVEVPMSTVTADARRRVQMERQG
jgi:serine/threonine-protein kinase RsbW